MEQILIVEDDSFLNKMVAYNLTADGYGVTSALNARTAAEAIRQRQHFAKIGRECFFRPMLKLRHAVIMNLCNRGLQIEV